MRLQATPADSAAGASPAGTADADASPVAAPARTAPATDTRLAPLAPVSPWATITRLNRGRLRTRSGGIAALAAFTLVWTWWTPGGVIAALTIGVALTTFAAVGFTTIRMSAATLNPATGAASHSGAPSTGVPGTVEDLATLAHDLRSPLITLASYLDMLETGEFGDLPDEARFITTRGVQVVEQLSSMIESAVTAAAQEAAMRPLDGTAAHLDERAIDQRRTDQPHANTAIAVVAPFQWADHAAALDITTTSTDTNAVLADVTAALGAQLRVSRATLIVGMLPPVNAARDTVTRVLLNLIGNALAHGHAPDVPPRVTVAGWENGADAEFVVRDQGPGFKPAADSTDATDPAVLFTAGVRGSTAASGDGLGLSTVQRLVEAAGGRVWIDTAASGGAVRFTLPLATLPLAPVATEPGAEASRQDLTG